MSTRLLILLVQSIYRHFRYKGENISKLKTEYKGTRLWLTARNSCMETQHKKLRVFRNGLEFVFEVKDSTFFCIVPDNFWQTFDKSWAYLAYLTTRPPQTRNHCRRNISYMFMRRQFPLAKQGVIFAETKVLKQIQQQFFLFLGNKNNILQAIFPQKYFIWQVCEAPPHKQKFHKSAHILPQST